MKFNVERYLPPRARRPGSDTPTPPLTPAERTERFAYSLDWGWSSKHRKPDKKKGPRAA